MFTVAKKKSTILKKFWEGISYKFVLLNNIFVRNNIKAV